MPLLPRLRYSDCRRLGRKTQILRGRQRRRFLAGSGYYREVSLQPFSHGAYVSLRDVHSHALLYQHRTQVRRNRVIVTTQEHVVVLDDGVDLTQRPRGLVHHLHRLLVRRRDYLVGSDLRWNTVRPVLHDAAILGGSEVLATECHFLTEPVAGPAE